MEKIEVEFELNSKDATKKIKDLEKEIGNLKDDVKNANKSTEDSLKGVEKAAGESAKGVGKVGVSLKSIASATGIVFLLQKAFEFVSQAIQENQTVMDSLNVVFETAQIVFNQIVNVFTDVYKAVASSSENFDALGKVLKGLLTVAITPLKLSFFAIKLALQSAQLAWEQSFFGDGNPETIARLNEGIQETKTNLAEVAKEAVEAGKDIASNIVEAVTEVGAIGEKVITGLKKVSVKAAMETAKTNIQLKKSAAIAQAESRMALERYATESEKLRQLRDDDRNSIEDRIEANNKLKQVLKDQQKEMLNNVAMVEKAAQAQFNLT